jgi:ABC-type multidrug transport system fused ATPase/permease subunit
MRTVERGRHHELLALNGQYAELYRAQFQRQEPTTSTISRS